MGEVDAGITIQCGRGVGLDRDGPLPWDSGSTARSSPLLALIKEGECTMNATEVHAQVEKLLKQVQDDGVGISNGQQIVNDALVCIRELTEIVIALDRAPPVA